MWEAVGTNVAAGKYHGYPRLVGETGGKDFILAHASADAEAVATAVIRGSFEYQGQKCSAASRLYVPSNLWPEVKEKLVADVATIRMGDPTDFENFMGAVIDAGAFKTQADAIAEARAAGAEILTGGSTDDSEGYFVEPTVITTEDKVSGSCATSCSAPSSRPTSTTRALGRHAAPRRRDRPVRAHGRRLRDRALGDRGGARRAPLLGRQLLRERQTDRRRRRPAALRGTRASGTNDKAGSMWNLIRWVSPRTVKEAFVPPTDYRYPFLAPDSDGKS